MAISFDKALGVHPQAMILRAERAELLAGNIANADTPGYKAKDMDFAAAMQQATKAQRSSGQSSRLATTNDRHLNGGSSINDTVKFRVPDQPDTGDGNTVDIMTERNKYLQNSIEYRASFQFLNGKISGLKKALTGGQQ